MKKLSIIPLILFIVSGSNAQIKDQILVGILGGLTYSNILKNSNIPGNTYFIPGFNSGACVKFKLKSNISIETNISYYQNGFKFNDEQTLIMPDFKFTKSYEGYEYKTKEDYLNNTWLVGYSIGNRIECSANLGLYWAIFLNSKYTFKYYIFVDIEEWAEFGDPDLPKGYREASSEGQNNEQYKSFDFGLAGRIEVAIYLNKKLQLVCLPGYYQGFIANDQTDVYHNKKVFNSSFNIGLGLKYKL